jgi:peptidylprolyl isomerase
MKSRYLVVAPLLAAGLIAGCGGSSNSDTAKIQLPTSQSQTLTYSATSTTTTSTSTTPTVATPSSGPLSKEPKITVPKTPAPTKLVTTDVVKGTGATAKAGDTVTVNYVGALYSNGKTFDASWSRNMTFSTALLPTAVIQGWVDGIPGMKVGGRRELIIPPALAYKNVSQGTIPANSTLIFIVDLLKVTPAS